LSNDLQDLKLFQKTYDYYEWVYPHLKNYPKSERFTLVQNIEYSLLELLSLVIMARKTNGSQEYLEEADRELEKLRVFMRLSKDLEFISLGLYEDSSEKIDEIGKLLGGWMQKS